MPIAQSLLPEFDHEMENTRKVLERVPENKFDYKPHPKSGSMGWLATHLAEMCGWTVMVLNEDSFDIAPAGAPPYQPANPKSRAELLALFDKNVAAARAAISKTTDQQLMAQWSLLKTGESLFTMPRIAVLRGMIMNHMIHHRAQLGVYLRLNDVAVPGLYGPSADEQAPLQATA